MGTQVMTLLEYCEQNLDKKYLLDEWDYEKNVGLDPATIGFRANKKIHWKLHYVVPEDYKHERIRGKHFDFEWISCLKDRLLGYGCPYLSGRFYPSFNDLTVTHPELAAQWHPLKNGNLLPDDFNAKSNKKVWWIYNLYDVDTFEIKTIEWEESISNRTIKNTSIPKRVEDFIENMSVIFGKTFKGLMPEVMFPENLLDEWDFNKNGDLDIFDFDVDSHNEVWWLLEYDVPDDYPVAHLRGKHFNFEWRDSIRNRVKDPICPFLNYSRIWQGFNDLATTHPEIATQWHPNRNRKLISITGKDVSTPKLVTPKNKQKVWWYLPYDVPNDYPIEHLRGKHFDFEWETAICDRVKGYGCPFIAKSNPSLWKGFNDFATTHPELAKQWHPTKNGSLRPEDVSHGYRNNVWWLFPYDDPKTGKHHDYEWEARIPDRINKNRGCPFLYNSFGEQQIAEVLDKYKIHYKPQYKFPDRKRNIFSAQPLRDDFAILDNNDKPIGTIEYNGQQHYYPISFNGEDAAECFKNNQERDRIKSEYLATRGIPQLIIPYWDYDNIEKIVVNYLKKT